MKISLFVSIFLIVNIQNINGFIPSNIQKPRQILRQYNNNQASSNGWKPILHPFLRNNINRTHNLLQDRIQVIPQKPILYITPIIQNFTSNFQGNDELSRDAMFKNDEIQKMTSKIVEKKMPSKRDHDKRSDLEAIIEEKMEKSLRTLVDRLDKIIEIVVLEAVKKTGIHHQSAVEVTETGNSGVSKAGTANNEPVEESRKSTLTDSHDAVNKPMKIDLKPDRKHTLIDQDAENSENFAYDRHVKSLHRESKSVYPSGPTKFFHKSGFNSLEHSPPDPYVALMLSHYGKYLPGTGNCINHPYSYLASNNIHNNMPFGSYKIYEDSDG